MICLHEFLDVQAGMMDGHVDAAANRLTARRDRRVKTVGFFENAL